MLNRLIEDISKDLRNQSSDVLLIENNDKFLFREDVISTLNIKGIKISIGTSLKHRVDFELRSNELLLILLSDSHQKYLEDMVNLSKRYEFFLENYLDSYHIPSIINEGLFTLNALYERNHVLKLSRRDTIAELKLMKSNSKKSIFDYENFKSSIESELEQKSIDWGIVITTISMGLAATIGSKYYDRVVEVISDANNAFQKEIEQNYHHLRSSSAAKSPKLVSKVLDYIDFNFRKNRIALIVIDGLSCWQYALFNERIQGFKQESYVYSWLPSITQLSRQAIFRGDTPESSYKQNPTNEEKLWTSYWKAKGYNDFEIRYNHEDVNLTSISTVKRYALVFKDLDDYMHGSKDYVDLIKLTENWINRSKLIAVINQLLKKGFVVFITSDHGNIHAKGWRSLKGREKLGTNKSGSRSERHIEYSENWLKEDFLTNNPEISDSIVQDEQALYFSNDYSFSFKESLVTHGGSHILEVVVPFIEIKNEE